MKILIDGDACGIISLVERIAKRNQIQCHVYANVAHNIATRYSEVHVVDQHRDSVDFTIVNRCCPGDIVITSDGGLASMALAKKAFVMNPYGYEYTEENINLFLARRYLQVKAVRDTRRNRSRRAVSSGHIIARENPATLLQRMVDKATQTKQ